jgi:hypothetical protein
MSIDQKKITEIHRSAMRLAHEAAEAAGPELARETYARAFEKEREAAALLATAFSVEPTRAILHRSAVSLGKSGQRLTEAYAVLMDGLVSRSAEVRAELRELQGEIRSLAASMNAADARRHLAETWNPYDWRERMPEILASYLGKMDRYLELNGFSVAESKEIVLVALARLRASDAHLEEIAELDLALFDLLHDLCGERRPRRGPPA